MTDFPSVPDGYLAVTPWAIVDGAAEFMAFLAEVFSAVEVIRLPGPDGLIVHAEMRINGGPLLLFDRAQGWGPTPAFLRVYVPDVDAVLARAEIADAVVISTPVTYWFGDRAARIRDPWDNLWWVHQRMFEPTPEQLAAGPPPAEQELMATAARTLEEELRRRARG